MSSSEVIVGNGFIDGWLPEKPMVIRRFQNPPRWQIADGPFMSTPHSIIRELNLRDSIYVSSEEDRARLIEMLEIPSEVSISMYRHLTEAFLSAIYGNGPRLDQRKICLYDQQRLKNILSSYNLEKEIMRNPLIFKTDFVKLIKTLETIVHQLLPIIKITDHKVQIYGYIEQNDYKPTLMLEKTTHSTVKEFIAMDLLWEITRPIPISLEEPNLQNSEYTGINICNIDFDKANFRGSRWKGVSFLGCSFSGADLRDAQFINVVLIGGTFKDCIMDEQTEITVPDSSAGQSASTLPVLDIGTIISIGDNRIFEKLISIFFEYLKSINSSDKLDLLFNHINNNYSILRIIDSMEESTRKNQLIQWTVGYLNTLNEHLLNPLIPSLLDILIQDNYLTNPIVSDFVVNKLIIKKIEESNSLVVVFTDKELSLIVNYLEHLEDGQDQFFLKYKNIINYIILIGGNQSEELERAYLSSPSIAPIWQKAKELEIWVDLETLEGKIEEQMAVLRKSATRLHALGVIDASELESMDIEQSKSYYRRFSAVKGTPPIQTTGNDPRLAVGEGSGLLGSRGLLSRLPDIQKNPDLLDHVFDDLYPDEATRMAARNVLNIHFKPMIKEASPEEVRSRLLALTTDMPIWIHRLEENRTKKEHLSQTASLLFPSNEPGTALIVSREFFLKLKNFQNPEWSTVELMQSNLLDECNKSDPQVLLEKFSPFPIFKNGFRAEINKGNLLKHISLLNLGHRYKDFADASQKSSHYIDMTPAQDQEELMKIFREFFQPFGEYKGALYGEVRLKAEHLTGIFNVYSIENSTSELKAYYLFVLSCVFTKYSSSYFFGKPFISPIALREYSLALFNGACDLCPEMRKIGDENRIRERLIGARGAFECTGLLSGDMARVCKSSDKREPSVEKSLSEVFREICPLGWQSSY